MKLRKNRKVPIRNRPSRKPARVRRATEKLGFQPEVIIFDVDGVLVDVRGSFHSTVLETVRFFTGQKVTRAQLHQWKNRSGFNDDWKLSTAWVRSLGGKQQYDEVKKKFVELYWGVNGKRGNVDYERWLLPRAALQRLAKRAELALFTGRVRTETDYTLEGLGLGGFFKQIVTAEDVAKPKPDPEGLLKILGGRDRAKAVYLGDNVDDAIAAAAAAIPFVGVLPQAAWARRERRALLTKHGALLVLRDVKEFEKRLPKE